MVDGPGRIEDVATVFRQEIQELLEPEFSVTFTGGRSVRGAWSTESVRRELDGLLANPRVDAIVTVGTLASQEASRRASLAKPTFAPFVIDPELQGLPTRQGASGVRNLSYLASAVEFPRTIEIFRDVVRFEKLVMLGPAAILSSIPGIEERIHAQAKAQGFEVIFVGVRDSIDEALAAIPADTDAVYMAPLMMLSPVDSTRLVAELEKRKLPTFSFLGHVEVRSGVLVGLRPPNAVQRIARRVALNLQATLLGEDPSTFPVAFPLRERLAINLTTAHAIGFYPRFDLMTEAELFGDADPKASTFVEMREAIEEALRANRDLLSRARGVEAGMEGIARARAALLPRIDVGASARVLDADRAAASFGANPERSLDASLRGRQLLFDESAWSGLAVETQLQLARAAEYQSARLDLVAETSVAYVNLLRSIALDEVRRENLRVSRENLELARIRRGIGASGPAEVHRWESQIASDRQAVIDSAISIEIGRIALNRLRQRPSEEFFEVKRVTPESLGLVYADPRLGRYTDDPWKYRVYREFLSTVAAERSPELAAIDAQLRAQERSLAAARRAFFSPIVDLQGEVGRRLADGGETGESAFSSIPGGSGSSTPDDTQWSVGLGVSLPLFTGGARRATARQAERELKGLRDLRRATAARIDERVRTNAWRTGGAFVTIGLAQQSADAASKNFELVADLYSRGGASILDLLDAQNAALVADLLAANARSNFLIEHIGLMRSLGFFDFMMAPNERDEYLDRFEAYYLNAREKAGRDEGTAP